jgi:hypothetical protein
VRCRADPRAHRRRSAAFAAPPRIRSGPVDAETLGAVTAILGVEREKVVDAEWLDNGPGWVGVLLDSAQPASQACGWLIGEPRDR